MGTLYVVATPIGNLSDITLRALEVLKAVDVILCEDTRVTAKLARRYGIGAPRRSFFSGNEAKRVTEALGLLLDGKTVALVTDAGTPCISDPGYLLVKECRRSGIPVVPVPGPSALAAALSVSGLPGHRILFLGFPPRKAGARKRLLEEVAGDPSTLVFYEAPHRIRPFLEEAKVLLAGRECVVGRELTKRYESVSVGNEPEEIPERGEFVVLFGPPGEGPAGPVDAEEISRRVAEMVAAGLEEKEAMRALAKETGLSRREVYTMVKVKR